MQNAGHLIKSLDQRANTILKVASAIAKYQEDFFRRGIYHLKPMKLNDIASETGLHESTISRAVNKYIATPNGTYEMKYFFSTNVSHDSMSNKTVQMMIKKLIDNEHVNHILSDTEISKILAAERIKIARRTITKYRESMDIPPMAQRKIDKK
jgi:RNA polymerase sigma-54 factor